MTPTPLARWMPAFAARPLRAKRKAPTWGPGKLDGDPRGISSPHRASVTRLLDARGQIHPGGPRVAYLGRGTVAADQRRYRLHFHLDLGTSSILSLIAHLVQRPMKLVLSSAGPTAATTRSPPKSSRNTRWTSSRVTLSIGRDELVGREELLIKSSARAIRLIRLAVFSSPSMRLPFSCSLARCNFVRFEPVRAAPGRGRRGSSRALPQRCPGSCQHKR